MRSNIVLIDFENVQPDAFCQLSHDHVRVLVFVGANQKKISFDVVDSIQRLGTKAEYVKISGNGPNALDFHIAYYIGRLATEDPTASFHIVSKDAGFDPLIAHLRSKKITARRVKSIDGIPFMKAVEEKPPEQRARLFMERLAQPKATRPRSIKTLSSSISHFFQKQLSDEEVAAAVASLQESGAIALEGSKVVYPALGES